MFGSKLRSWMENHIVRPRKKGTKVKNSSSHEAYSKKNTTAALTLHHNSNGSVAAATLQSISSSSSTAPTTSSCTNNNGCCSGISSPVRRREVSPIQGHTQSRYGWQSPDKEIVTSPKSDNFLYAPQHHRVKSHNLQQQQLQHQLQHQQQQQQQQYNGTPDIAGDGKSTATRSLYNHHYHQHQSKLQTHQQSQPQADCSSSSISSLSWSTGSKEPSSHSNMNGSHNNTQPKPHQAIEIRNSSFSDLPNLDEDPDAVHYEEVCTILRHPEQLVGKKHGECYERPKSEQLTSFAPIKTTYAANRSQDDASTRYGRLLPSKIQNCNGSIDGLSVHGCMNRGSFEYMYSNTSNTNSHHADATSHMTGTCHVSNNFGSVVVQTPQNVVPSRRYGNERAWNGAPGAVPMHSLSSPESAYSTGYSTDGTSPGAIYTPPEYYINMRTGTHYFPKSINSLAIEAQRYKFGLNKIEEMSPIEPMPKTSFGNVSALNKHADSYDIGPNKNPSSGKIQVNTEQMGVAHPSIPAFNIGSNSPLALRSANTFPTLKGIESPSPRQRCRIRTNPWYATPDTSSVVEPASVVGTQLTQMPSQIMPPLVKSTTSSSVVEEQERLSTQTRMTNRTESEEHSGKIINRTDTSDSSSSLTEVENMETPNTIRRKRAELFQHAMTMGTSVGGQVAVAVKGRGSDDGRPSSQATISGEVVADYKELHMSDDDTTLNEMMGKFDESYVYEKETDILSSDSDLTDCPSDLDTGQDAGDECDTDDLLDIDFIDTSSTQEVYEQKEMENNLGNCCYFNHSPKRSPKRRMELNAVAHPRRISRSMKMYVRNEMGSRSGTGGGSGTGMGLNGANGTQRRRKRFMKTRKKSNENRDVLHSPRKSRQSRSVGGTPVCLRRKQVYAKARLNVNAPLFNRSSSLGFMNAVDPCRFMTIAESEKALLKADIEADVKYRQLILEAESILVSMKSSLQSIPRDTPVSSPRRVNPLANKRVEMLKSCENDPKRDKLKQSQQRSLDGVVCSSTNAEQELAAAINRRIEKLRSESASAPNSPKFGRCSPRKTHLTNFINQNVLADVPLRSMTTGDNVGVNVLPSELSKRPQSPQIQLNGRHLQQSPNASPLQRRRFRSQSPLRTGKRLNKINRIIDSDSELRNGTSDMLNENYLPEFARVTLYDETDLQNHNYVCGERVHEEQTVKQRKLLEANTCPQSEPLKRKVYKGSSTFERIKRSFDLELDIPKRSLTAQVHNLHEHLQQNCGPSEHLQHLNDSCGQDNQKKQMILNTIADLKRSLENQSIELNGFNED